MRWDRLLAAVLIGAAVSVGAYGVFVSVVVLWTAVFG